MICIILYVTLSKKIIHFISPQIKKEISIGNIYIYKLLLLKKKIVLPENGKFPVMFYIHGGGFEEGSGNDDLYGPDFLINENVILVGINVSLVEL